MRYSIILSVAFCAMLAGRAIGADDENSTKVDGAFVIPKDVATFAGHVVDIHL